MKNVARTLPRRVLEHIRTCGLWKPGDKVAVSVSGGVDSMVLLHVLHQTQAAHGAILFVVTIDHGLRTESAAEARFVAATSAELGLPCEMLSLSLEPGPNLAERAREARRAVLLRFGADGIATGHHQGDQAETVLYHLLRGSGMRGLRGMQAKSGIWTKPLLREPRGVLEDWARSQGIDWIEDPSNASSQRGRIRMLLPALNVVHGGAGRALARSARLLAREDAFVSGLTDTAWDATQKDGGLSRSALAQHHPAIQLRLLRRLTRDVRVPAEPLESIVDGALLGGGSLDLGHGLRLVQRGDILCVEAE